MKVTPKAIAVNAPKIVRGSGTAWEGLASTPAPGAATAEEEPNWLEPIAKEETPRPKKRENL